MFLQEAIAAGTDEKPYIARERWIDKRGGAVLTCRVRPRSYPSGFLCKVMDNPPIRHWQPTMDDVLADDWFNTY